MSITLHVKKKNPPPNWILSENKKIVLQDALQLSSLNFGFKKKYSFLKKKANLKFNLPFFQEYVFDERRPNVLGAICLCFFSHSQYICQLCFEAPHSCFSLYSLPRSQNNTINIIPKKKKNSERAQILKPLSRKA